MVNPNTYNSQSPDPEIPHEEAGAGLHDAASDPSTKVTRVVGVLRAANVIVPDAGHYEGMHDSLRLLLLDGLQSRNAGNSHGQWPL